jgi:cell filamentation protein
MIDDPEQLDPHYDFKHDILKNVRGFTTRASLLRYERIKTAASLTRLAMQPVKGAFDRDHLQAIHRRIFAEVFPWAGEFRHVNMSRRNSHPFATVQGMERRLEACLEKLAEENYLRGLDADDYSARAAYFLGALNSIHPFRDGNGRAQREFLRELAEEAGYNLNWSRISHTQMYQASDDHHNLGHLAGLVEVMWSAIEPAHAGQLTMGD